jgi:phi13 family phage major tail protein
MKKGITGIAYAMAHYDKQAGTLTYDAPRYLPSAVAGGREYSANPRGDSQKVYADSIAVYGDTINDGYDLDVTLLSTFDNQFREDLLNEVDDGNGIAEYANVTEFPYMAIIIHEETSDGVGLTSVYYYCQASGRPSDSGKTAEQGNFDFEFPQYPIVASPRPTDRLVRYQIPGTEHLQEVPEPSNVVTPDVILSRSNLTMTVGDHVTIPIKVTPTSEYSSVTTSATGADKVDASYISSDHTVHIAARAAGTSVVTASITVDGTTYSDSCKVTVEAET